MHLTIASAQRLLVDGTTACVTCILLGVRRSGAAGCAEVIGTVQYPTRRRTYAASLQGARHPRRVGWAVTGCVFSITYLTTGLSKASKARLSTHALIYSRHSFDTSLPSLSSSHHVLCLKPAEEMADARAFSSASLSADVSCDLNVPSAGRSSIVCTRR